MEVILLQDVKALGKKGEKVKVSDGYARNFILPKKLGVEATAKNVNDLKLQKKHEDKMAELRLQEAKELAAKLSETKVELKAKIGANGKLFGSLSSQAIAEALEKAGVTVDKKKIVLDSPIKQIGEYKITVKLHPEVSAKITLSVVAG